MLEEEFLVLEWILVGSKVTYRTVLHVGTDTKTIPALPVSGATFRFRSGERGGSRYLTLAVPGAAGRMPFFR